MSDSKPPNDGILDSGELSDVTFLVGDQNTPVRAHKLILARASPVFKAMFYGDMAERRDTIPLPDICPLAFKTCLGFIYDKAFAVDTFEAVSKVYYVAQKYFLSDLAAQCSVYFMSTKSIADVLLIYELAKLYSDRPLSDDAMTYCCQNIDEILSHDSFLRVSVDTLIDVFRRDELNVCKETDLVSALVKYAEANSRDAKTDPDIKKAAGLIRFLAMSPKEFVDCKDMSKLFYDYDTFALLSNVCSDSSSIPLPEGLDGGGRVPRRDPHRLILCRRSVCDVDFPNVIEENTVGRTDVSADRDIYITALLIATVHDPEERSPLELVVSFLTADGGCSVKRKVCIESVGRTETRVYMQSNVYIPKNEHFTIQIQFLSRLVCSGRFVQEMVRGDHFGIRTVIFSNSGDNTIGSVLRGIAYYKS